MGAGDPEILSAARDALYPQSFSRATPATNPYLLTDPAQKLADFFHDKGLAALKDEDRQELWYADWIAYQAEHRIYARLLAPQQLSTLGSRLDLLALTRFLELFAYFSPAHGYSLQVTFLGLFSILMGNNAGLKSESVAAVEAGGLLAFGISERHHGSDLLANEFTVRPLSPGQYQADGKKYYIGNANAASIVSILARKEDPRRDARDARTARNAQAGVAAAEAGTPGATATNPADDPLPARSRRAPILFALRPQTSPAFHLIKKIRTLGIRAAYVGEFQVTAHAFPESDLLAEGRDAWDAVFGAVTLGKFFLGFGSIGICEHAFEEAAAHLSRRTLFAKPVLEMPHIRAAVATAWARLTAMKLYAYRALDYVHAAHADDRRYLLFTAVQKAKVSTEGVKVMALLSECIGAKGFESDTYFEMALRDAPLIPVLEGSAHINLSQAAQFAPRYFARRRSANRNAPAPVWPPSLVALETPSVENPYLFEARTAPVTSVEFPPFLEPFRALTSVPAVRTFAAQANALSLALHRRTETARAASTTGAASATPAAVNTADTQFTIALGRCLATVSYAGLVVENATRLALPREIVAVIFHTLVQDLSTEALALAASHPAFFTKTLTKRLIAIPTTTPDDWRFVAAQVTAYSQAVQP